jgi:hypothetical protein
MLRYAADENFNNDIVWGLLRRNPKLDILRIQDVGLAGADDPTVLAWTADTSRLLLTHDVKTITRYAYERIARGELVFAGTVQEAEAATGSISNEERSRWTRKLCGNSIAPFRARRGTK